MAIKHINKQLKKTRSDSLPHKTTTHYHKHKNELQHKYMSLIAKSSLKKH